MTGNATAWPLVTPAAPLGMVPPGTSLKFPPAFKDGTWQAALTAANNDLFGNDW